jgi:Sec-independent protein secretion pathway component TatC
MSQFTPCSFLVKKWKYAVVASFVLGAVIAPSPDVKTMVSYALPIFALYGLSVGVAWLS